MAGPEKAVDQTRNTEARQPSVGADGEIRVSDGALERETINRSTASEALLGEFLSTGGKDKAVNDNRVPHLTDASLPGLEIAAVDGSSNEVVQEKVASLEASKANNTRELQAKSGGKSGDRAEFNLHKLLTDGNQGIMPELRREGKLASEWALYPTQSGSPADKIGGDFLLVNKQTGEFHLIDATVNENKQNTYRLRENGIVTLDNRWFDPSGALDREHSKPEIREGAEQFRADLKRQIVELTQSKSPFKIGDMPMPSATVVDEAKTKAQVEQISKWAAEKAADANNPDRAEFRQMSEVVKRALTHQDKTAREVRSDPLRDKAREIAKRDIANYVFHGPERYEDNYVKNKRGASNGKSDVVVLKDGGVRLEHKGENLHGGTTGEAIENAMRELMKPGALLAQLNNTQLKELGVSQDTINQFKKLRGPARQAAIEKLLNSSPDLRTADQKIMERWYRHKGSVANEGNHGDTKNALRESIRLSLRNSETYQLTGEEPPQREQPKEKPKPKTIHERSPLGRQAVADLQRNFVQTAGEHPGTAYSLDAHLALMEMEPKNDWSEKQKQELQRLKDGYEKGDTKVIREVNELVIPERSESGNKEAGERKGTEVATERKGTTERSGEPVRTAQDHATETLTERSAPKPVDVNVLVTRYNADGTTTQEAKPLSKLSNEQIIRKFENIDQKIAEAKRLGQNDAARELERHRDEYNKRTTPKEKLAYIEQIRQEAKAISEHGSGIGGKLARGSSTAVAVMMLLDFAIPAAHADESSPTRVIPRLPRGN